MSAISSQSHPYLQKEQIPSHISIYMTKILEAIFIKTVEPYGSRTIFPSRFGRTSAAHSSTTYLL